MKRILTLIIVVILAFSLTACSQNSDSDSSYATSSSQTEESTSSVVETNIQDDEQIGGDAIDPKHVEEFHTITKELIDLVGTEKVEVFSDLFISTEDFNPRFFCDYFGISKEKYIETIENSKSEFLNKKIMDANEINDLFNVRQNYHAWFSEDYLSHSDFLRDNYVQQKTKSVTIRDPEDKIHTDRYFTISHQLIDYVGQDKFEEFKSKFAGTKDFNVINFVNYFDISKEKFIEIIDYKPLTEGTIPLCKEYNPNYVYGTPEMIEAYFTYHPIDFSKKD